MAAALQEADGFIEHPTSVHGVDIIPWLDVETAARPFWPSRRRNAGGRIARTAAGRGTEDVAYRRGNVYGKNEAVVDGTHIGRFGRA